MAFQVSPGVSVAEVDLTTRVPVPSVSDGATAGIFKWGPINTPVMVTTEDELVSKFGKPDDDCYKSFFSASNFLSYSNKLRVVRAERLSMLNATTGASGLLVGNTARYQNTYESTTTSGTSFIAKHPGALGNSMKISLCLPDRANTTVTSDNQVALSSNQQTILTGNFTSSIGATTITIADDGASGIGKADEELRVGDVLLFESGAAGSASFDGRYGLVTSVSNNSMFALELANGSPVAGSTGQMTNQDKLIRVPRSSFRQTAVQHAVNQFGTVTFNPSTDDSRTLSGTDTRFTHFCTVGDILKVTDDNGVVQERQITAIANSTSLTVREPYTSAITAKSIREIAWEFADEFIGPPLTSTYAYKESGNKDALDEIHVITVDEDGQISSSGRKDRRGKVTEKQIIFKGEGLSVANNSISADGQKLFYKEFINDNSEWVWWADHDVIGDEYQVDSQAQTVAWGSNVHSTMPFNGAYNTGAAPLGRKTMSFSHGTDGNSPQDADYIAAFAKLRQPGEIDVSLLVSGETSNTVANYLISDLAEHRKDCVVFVSPQEADVVNQGSTSVQNMIDRRKALPSSSYAVMDGNYKYQYDRYNAKYRYVPFNGDIAGLCAASDNLNPFISPAGFNRGNLKNVDNLALESSRADRDDLYINGINPIISPAGGGKVLLGDKTLLAKPSSFDRINVRRLFIILEKAIANAAQFSLFEFNDEITRANFVAQVTPFLRDVANARGITDFRVVCDESNNPPSVIDRNEFKGDIFIKPARSINFISLNFVAVATGVEFNEVINAV